MALETKVVTITPEIAANWLQKNMKNNRRINKDTVKRYARIMKTGGWDLTHQGIAFDDKGVLIDGQHRLVAICMANKPVDMMVTWGVEHTPGDALNIDVGQKRTLKNIMQISGIEDKVYNAMGRVVVNYYRWKRPGHERPDPTEVIAYIDRHDADLERLYNMMQLTAHGGRGTRMINGFVGAAMLAALYRGESEDALRQFTNVYRLNNLDGCAKYNARHALNVRDYVRDHRESDEGFARVESAICAFAKNKNQLYVRDNHYPYDPVMDA